MDGVFHQRRLVDLLVIGLPLLVVIVGVFVLGLISLALPVPRQRQALKVIDRLMTLGTDLRQEPTSTTSISRGTRRRSPSQAS